MQYKYIFFILLALFPLHQSKAQCPTLSATITPVACFNGATGAIALSFNGDTASLSSYTYIWSNGATTKDVSSLTAGTYTVTVTSDSCTVNSTYTLTQSPALNVSVTTSPTSCDAATNGAANTTVSGGVAPYIYLWSNDSSTFDISQLTAGDYTVTVTDAVGCSVSTTATVDLGNDFPSGLKLR
jgi:hypothetical protein